MKKKRRLLPYWLFGSDVTCAECEGPHAHAVSGRCAACDCSVCPTCAHHLGGELFCPSCGAKEEKKPKWRRVRSGKA